MKLVISECAYRQWGKLPPPHHPTTHPEFWLCVSEGEGDGREGRAGEEGREGEGEGEDGGEGDSPCRCPRGAQGTPHSSP